MNLPKDPDDDDLAGQIPSPVDDSRRSPARDSDVVGESQTPTNLNLPIDQNTRRRRAFLAGKDALRWWKDWGRDSLKSPPSVPGLSAGIAARSKGLGPSVRPGFLTEISKSAMACQWDVFLNHGQYPWGAEFALTALEALEPLEAQLSVFRSTSEVCQLNRTAFTAPVKVSDSLWNLLQLSKVLWELTEGAFDITSSSLSQCWGFLKREGRMPSDQEVEEALKSVGMEKVVLDPQQQTVQFFHPDLSINLGGIGKGWSLDQVADGLQSAGVDDFVFHSGKSSVVARGTKLREQAANPKSANLKAANPGWQIGLSHPLLPSSRLGNIDLTDRALGTSGSGRQFIHYRGRRLSHILDPRSGRPAEGVLSATVLAPTAAQADALGTACFVLGVEGCQRLSQQCDDLGIILVIQEKSRSEVVLIGDIQQAWQPTAVKAGRR